VAGSPGVWLSVTVRPRWDSAAGGWPAVERRQALPAPGGTAGHPMGANSRCAPHPNHL